MSTLSASTRVQIDSDTSGVMTRLVFTQHLVNTSGAESVRRDARGANMVCSKGCGDNPIISTEHEEYQDTLCKIRIFFYCEWKLFEKFFAYLKNLDREVESVVSSRAGHQRSCG